jgi:REP element-mobilizing transposase RayT
MPRAPRLDSPGLVYHVMARGIERRAIFRDDRDRRDLFDRFSRLLPEERCTCFAWVFMPNHFHAVLKTGATASLSRFMARLLTGYARRFNERHARVGHFFQNRYRSRIVGDESYLRSLLRYVHRNPIRGGIVSCVAELDDYPWSGHSGLMGRGPDFVQADCVLAWFGSEQEFARQRLREWMESDAEEGPDVDRACEVEAMATPQRDGGDRGRDLPALLASVADSHGLEVDEVLGPSRARDVSAARALAAWRASRELGMSVSELARVFGFDRSSASRAVTRGRRIARGLGAGD